MADTQSSIDYKPHGMYSPPDRLRLRIVEMAEKRSRGGSGSVVRRGGGSKYIPGPQHVGSTAEIPHAFYDLDKFEHSRNARIDVGILKPTNQGQQQFLYSRPSQDGSVVILPKERASAWLLRRFKQRHQGNGEDKNNTFAKPPIQPGSINPEPTKRVRITSGAKEAKCVPTEPSPYFSTALKNKSPEESETVSLVPTTHFPSNGSAKSKKRSAQLQRRNPFADRKQADSECNHGEVSITNLKHVKANQGYELKGSAMPTPPPRQSSAKKTGLFSASLEAFRRRLRLTSNKYSNRLHSDDVDPAEDYVIRPDSSATATAANTPHPYPSKTQYNIESDHHTKPAVRPRPPSDARRVDIKLRPGFILRNGGNVDKNSNTLAYGEPRRHVLNTLVTNRKTGDKTDENTKTSRFVRQLETHKPMPPLDNAKSVPNADININAVDDDDQESEALPFCTKQPLPNVKTYVVVNKPVVDSASKNDTPSSPVKLAPLTEHNLRLHDSLQAMLERRAKRMARFHKRQLKMKQQEEQQEELGGEQRRGQLDQPHQTQQQTIPRGTGKQFISNGNVYTHKVPNNGCGGEESDSSEDSYTSDRVRRWVLDVTEKSVLHHYQSPVEPMFVEPVSSRSLESAISFDQAIKQQIIVCV